MNRYINENLLFQSIKNSREFVFPVFNTSRLGNIVDINNFMVIFQRILVANREGITEEGILVEGLDGINREPSNGKKK